ncbi:MAG: DUF5996 family protein [Candidatus Eremiobacteraeota bacterium]|nr:DUF5996 family protein [Candidatus Eremiobacteraeota bacterium]
MLAPLPFDEWKDTKTTLHLMCQVVGKIRLGHVPYRSHWWNVTLAPTARGLTTGRMRYREHFFEIEFDFVEHRLIVRISSAHEARSFALHDGMAVADFYRAVFATPGDLGMHVKILDKPYGIPIETPFSADREHTSYDKQMVRRYWEALLWSADVFDQFGREFLGKESPAHLFWHGFDLAMGRYSGKAASGPPKPDIVQQEAYSQEVIAVGFWPGDNSAPAASYYTYTAPEPPNLTSFPLAPAGAGWFPSGSGHMGGLPYDAVRTADDPRA